jgi:muramidase (phage lysozyme)
VTHPSLPRLFRLSNAWNRVALVGITLTQLFLPAIAQAQPRILWESNLGNAGAYSQDENVSRPTSVNPINQVLPQFPGTPAPFAPAPVEQNPQELNSGESETILFPQPNGQPGGASQFTGSANLMAFLRMIRYAEGTSSQDGYQIMFTSRRFSSFFDHPRQMNCSNFRGRRLCSTAAGAYQFLDTTWDMIARKIGATDFGPGWQDRGATELIRRSGALADIEVGNIEQAISKTAGIWASFPRWSGDLRGRYSQAVKPMPELVRAFNHYHQQAMRAQQAVVSQRPQPQPQPQPQRPSDQTP